MMPKTVDLDLMEGTTIKLIDTFSGKEVEISGPETATGGNQMKLANGSVIEAVDQGDEAIRGISDPVVVDV